MRYSFYLLFLLLVSCKDEPLVPFPQVAMNDFQLKVIDIYQTVYGWLFTINVSILTGLGIEFISKWDHFKKWNKETYLALVTLVLALISVGLVAVGQDSIINQLNVKIFSVEEMPSPMMIGATTVAAVLSFCATIGFVKRVESVKDRR